VAIVAQVVAQVFAARRLAEVASHRACSSHLGAAEMGMYFEFLLFLQRWIRCRDDCRFPHVLADGHVVGRVGRFRSPPQNAVNGNGHANLEEKLANLSITEVSQFTASVFHRHIHVTPFSSSAERQSRASPGKQW
jgi:hypothetical protein